MLSKRLPAAIAMCKYVAFKAAPNSNCNLSKGLAPRGAPNSKCNVQVPCFQRGHHKNLQCASSLLCLQMGPNSKFRGILYYCCCSAKLIISKAFMLLIR